MKQLNEDALSTLLSDTSAPVLVDVYADWCGPCKRMMPVLEELQPEFPNTTFVKVDADTEYNLMQTLNVRSIPTLVMYNTDGTIAAKWEGGQDIDQIRSWIASNT